MHSFDGLDTSLQGTDGRMDGCLVAWLRGCFDRWRRIDVSTHRQMDRQRGAINGWVERDRLVYR